MMVIYPLAVVSTFLWTGFVCAISFMEAWLKFRAPGINLPLGLGIGRIVFKALNKMEWVFTLAIAVSLLLEQNRMVQWTYIWYAVAVFILFVQSIWLLPALDKRAELHIQGKPVPPSRLHLYYVCLELVKVISLVIFGTTLFN